MPRTPARSIGPSDLAIGDDGTIWFLIGGPGGGESAAFRDGVPDGAAAAIGQLYRVGEDGNAGRGGGPRRL